MAVRRPGPTNQPLFVPAEDPARRRVDPGGDTVQPEDPSADAYLHHLQEIQARYLGEIERDFYPLPILRSRWFDKEMVGIERLRELANGLFGDRDPGELFFTGQAQSVTEEGDDFLLELPLPQVELDKVRLTKRGDELFVSIGNFKRELLLPSVLAQRDASGATFTGGVLKIRFPPASEPEAN